MLAEPLGETGIDFAEGAEHHYSSLIPGQLPNDQPSIQSCHDDFSHVGSQFVQASTQDRTQMPDVAGAYSIAPPNAPKPIRSSTGNETSTGEACIEGRLVPTTRVAESDVSSLELEIQEESGYTTRR